MINWRRWKKITEFIKTLPAKKIDMNYFCVINPEDLVAGLPGIEMSKMPVGDVIKHCGTVGCLAGWTALHVMPKKALMADYSEPEYAQRYFGLSDHDAHYVFYGQWSNHGLEELKKKHLVKYMTKALAARDIRVTID